MHPYLISFKSNLKDPPPQKSAKNTEDFLKRSEVELLVSFNCLIQWIEESGLKEKIRPLPFEGGLKQVQISTTEDMVPVLKRQNFIDFVMPSTYKVLD